MRKLRAYQNDAIRFLLRNKRGLIPLPMGAGKTVILLTWIKRLTKADPKLRVLILAPLRVANMVWLQERDEWRHLKGLEMTLATGSKAKRQRALDSGAQITVINHDVMPWLAEQYIEETWPFDVVIIDESTVYKSPGTKRFRSVAKFRHIIKYLALSSGTPTASGYEGLWAQIFLIDNGEALGTSKSQYLQRYFVPAPIPGLPYVKWRIKRGAPAHIQHAIRHLAFSVDTGGEHLPKSVHITHQVELPGYARTIYDELDTGFKVDVKQTGSWKYVTKNLSTKINALRQVVQGNLYSPDLPINKPDRETHHIHTAKLAALKEICEENPNEPILVYVQFKHDAKVIRESGIRDMETMDKDGNMVDFWNKRKIPLLVMHPKSAAHGLNMQHGGSIIVWYGLPWSLEHWSQGIGRLRRSGQKEMVRIISLVAKDTIDETVLKILRKRHAAHVDFIQSLYEELNHAR